MDVFLVPLGDDRYQLYCETPDHESIDDDGAPPGRLRAWARGFQDLLASAEAERRSRRAGRPDARPWTRRLRDRLLRWIAERVAEQRLLWHLRRQDQAVIVYPADLDEPTARRLVESGLRRDADRHRRWFIIDAIGAAITGPLFFFVPGPNLIAYYYCFRVVGHYLSMRGARHGLAGVVWHARADAALSEIRQAVGLAPAERTDRLRTVAARLGLERLAAFVERTAMGKS
jgi:hypothetical protein